MDSLNTEYYPSLLADKMKVVNIRKIWWICARKAKTYRMLFVIYSFLCFLLLFAFFLLCF